MKYLDLTGQRFGRLLVVKRVANIFYKKQSKIAFECVCDCGNIITVVSFSLKCGYTRSCGCLMKELNSARGKLRTGTENIKARKGLKYVTGNYYKTIKHGAKRRNVSFEITLEQIENLLISQNFKCKLSGMDIAIGYGSNFNITASLDRIDSLKGYTLDNVQWVHKDINFMKQDHSDCSFIELCKTVCRFQELKLGS